MRSSLNSARGFSHGACAALLLVMGAASAADTPPWTGEPYTGDFRLELRRPDGNRQTQRGEASARFVVKDGERVDLVIEAAVPGSSTRGDMQVIGAWRDGGWQSAPGAVTLKVTPDGRIEGGGPIAAEDVVLRLDGQVEASRLRLRNDVTLGAAQQGVPAGSVLSYRYDLRRARAATAGEENTEGCRLRHVPIANFGGGMTMAMVPDCSGD
ncbi:hypothetical protein IMZ29_12190 [Achromobacter sp. GG226]|uniref:hypothetical protein n=1 Tax=Verticiella alkaliphila TaxID=2779529 RepID=UPI001C0AD257|nr:hypothetical protein [Verticiella sp. GG226]MBU4611264.1 hypothetical protein [Verticiella sp. GG226]